MRHPFELNNSDLATVDLNIEELTNDEVDVVSDGDKFTTLALNEGGGTVSTKALGQEDGSCSNAHQHSPQELAERAAIILALKVISSKKCNQF